MRIQFFTIIFFTLFFFGCKEEEVLIVPDFTYAIYPNPFVESFNIDVSNRVNEPITIKIFNEKGEKSGEFIVTEKGEAHYSINVITGKPGVYYVEFVSAYQKHREPVIKK